MVGGRAAHNRSRGDQPAADLADDSLDGDAGKGPDVFEDVPGAGVFAHAFEHGFAKILAAVFALGLAAEDQLAAGDAGGCLAVPGDLAQAAEGAEAAACGDFDGMIAGRQVRFGGKCGVILVGRRVDLGGCRFFGNRGMFHGRIQIGSLQAFTGF